MKLKNLLLVATAFFGPVLVTALDGAEVKGSAGEKIDISAPASASLKPELRPSVIEDTLATLLAKEDVPFANLNPDDNQRQTFTEELQKIKWYRGAMSQFIIDLLQIPIDLLNSFNNMIKNLVSPNKPTQVTIPTPST